MDDPITVRALLYFVLGLIFGWAINQLRHR